MGVSTVKMKVERIQKEKPDSRQYPPNVAKENDERTSTRTQECGNSKDKRIEGRGGQRDEETRKQEDEETRRQRDEEKKGRKGEKTKRRGNKVFDTR